MALRGTCKKKQSKKPTTNGSVATVSVLRKLTERQKAVSGFHLKKMKPLTKWQQKRNRATQRDTLAQKSKRNSVPGLRKNPAALPRTDLS